MKLNISMEVKEMRYLALVITIAALAIIYTVTAQYGQRDNLQSEDSLITLLPETVVLAVENDGGTFWLNVNEMRVRCYPSSSFFDKNGNRIAPADLKPPLVVWTKLRGDGSGNHAVKEMRILAEGYYNENGDAVLPKVERSYYETY